MCYEISLQKLSSLIESSDVTNEKFIFSRRIISKYPTWSKSKIKNRIRPELRKRERSVIMTSKGRKWQPCASHSLESEFALIDVSGTETRTLRGRVPGYETSVWPRRSRCGEVILHSSEVPDYSIWLGFGCHEERSLSRFMSLGVLKDGFTETRTTIPKTFRFWYGILTYWDSASYWVPTVATLVSNLRVRPHRSVYVTSGESHTLSPPSSVSTRPRRV